VQTVRWEQDLRFRWNGIGWRIVGPNGPAAVLAQRGADHHILSLSIADLADWLEQGTLTIERPERPTAERPPTERLTHTPARDLAVAQSRLEAIRPLLEHGRVSGDTVRQIAVARQRGARTLWRWLAAYRAGGFEALLPARPHGRAREPQLADPAAHQVFEQVVEQEYLTPVAPSKAHVIRRVQDECGRRGMAVPPRSTLYGLLARLSPSLIAQRRENRAVYHARFLSTPTPFADTAATHPLHMVQIDHTLLDLELIDEDTGLGLGRPWLTLGFDVHSRMPWGYYLSFDPPSAVSVMLCIRHGVLLKRVQAKHQTQHDWPVFGIPAVVIVDNGKEFHSHHVEALCAALEITLRYRPRRTPRFGGVIERQFGILNQRVLHNLRGNTKTMVHVQTKNRDPKAEAVWTLRGLDALLHVYFADLYPFEVHRGLGGRTPDQAWTAGLNFAGYPRYPDDLDTFHRATLPVIRRTVSREGIVKDHLHYHHPSLKALVGVNQPVWVKWDPLDLSYVLVRHPQSEQWVRALATGGPDVQITALEYRRLRRYLAAQNQAVNRTTLRVARDQLRQLEAQAADAKGRIGRDIRRARASAALVPAAASVMRPVPGDGQPPPAQAAPAWLATAAVEGLPDL
jgi:transposase InsO family protein